MLLLLTLDESELGYTPFLGTKKEKSKAALPSLHL